MKRKIIFAIFIFYVFISICSIAANNYRNEIFEKIKVKAIVVSPLKTQHGSPIVIALETKIDKAQLKAELNHQWTEQGREKNQKNVVPVFSLGKNLGCIVNVNLENPGGQYEFSVYDESEKIFNYSYTIKASQKKTTPFGKAPQLSKKNVAGYQEEHSRLNKAMDQSKTECIIQKLFSNPLDKMFQTQGFGIQRIYSDTKSGRFHRGVDLRAPVGTPVKAIGPGIVIIADLFTLEGNLIVIDHGGQIFSSSMHLSKIIVKEDDKVDAGQIIGLSGSTGIYLTGPCLHLSIKVNGESVNPLELIGIINSLLEKSGSL